VLKDLSQSASPLTRARLVTWPPSGMAGAKNRRAGIQSAITASATSNQAQ
jgi:hypothetical protein